MRAQSGSQQHQRVYERFLELPRGMLVATLWLMGALLFGLCVLIIYLLVRLVVGA